MKRLGDALVFAGLVAGVTIRAFMPDQEDLFALAGLVLLAGSIILLASGAIRLFRGEVKLRPIDALKKAVVLFLIVLGLRTLLWVAFPSLDRDLNAAVLWSAIFAVSLGLYTTAYRKPA